MSEEKQLTLRDLLAIDRTRLANQRTLLAFIATGFHLLAIGITFGKFEQFEEVAWMATPFIVLAVIAWVVGSINYRKNRKNIEDAYNKSHLS